MKVKYLTVLKVWVAIRNIEKEKAGIKWAFAISKNKGRIQNDVEAIGAAEKLIMENDQARVKYCETVCEKDKDGKPVMEKINGTERFKGVNTNALELLAFVEKSIALNRDYQAMLEKETDIDFHVVDFDDVPKEIAPADYEALSIFIKEAEEPKK